MEKIKNVFDKWIVKSTPHNPIWNIEKKAESSPKWNYIDGCMLKSIIDMYYATSDEKYFEFVKNFVDYYIDDDGKILGYKKEDYNCDNINEGKILFDIYKKTNSTKYKLAIDVLYDQIKNQPRTKEGSFFHKLIYPNQVWLDGLYMVSPFYMEYEITFNNSTNYKDVIQQFQNVQTFMKDNKSGLFYHGFDSSFESFWADKKTGLSKNFWTRSIGWYCMAIVDTLEKMDKMFFYEYELLQQNLKNLIDSLMNYTDQNLFYQVTDLKNDPQNYLETSGSCAIAYTIMKASRLGYLPNYYYDSGFCIFKNVIKNKLTIQDDNLFLKDICLVAGLGGMPGKGDYKLRDGSKEYYFSEPKVINDAKGLAPFIFCYSEFLKK